MRKCLSLFLVLIIIFSVWVYFHSPPSNFPLNSIITISEGESLDQVTNQLHDDGIIRSPFFFKLAVYMQFGQKHIVAGDYLMDKKEGSVDIAYRLDHGQFDLVLTKLTIPEGWTDTQISDYVSKNILNFNSLQFSLLAKQGYNFPDTYFVSPIITPSELVERMQNNFLEKVQPLQNAITSSTHSENEIVTMASILEGEAKTSQDQEIVAGILWKRLSLGMPLQVDAVGHKYSYLHQGLPPVPIDNPGLGAIQAALNPIETQYLYYISDKNGNLHYAKTLEEQTRNIQKYL